MSKQSAATTGNSTKPSSPTGSVKKQKNNDTSEQPLTDDFVLMSTPDKFKDTNVNETNVAKVQRFESPLPLPEILNLDCLMLADTSVQCAPLHVQTLLQHFDNSHISQAEILFLLVYIVALESGFVSQMEYENAKLHINHLTSTTSFHSKNVLRLSRLKPSYTATEDKTRFTLKLCSIVNIETSCSEQLYALLTGFVTGDFLIVTLSPANATGAKGFSAALSIGRYVLSTQARNKPLYQRFRKLDELSNVLRDQLFMPMRCQHLFWLEACIYPCLDGMPAELYDNILQYLNSNQLKIMANVNKSLYNLTKSSKFLINNSDGLSCSDCALFQLH